MKIYTYILLFTMIACTMQAHGQMVSKAEYGSFALTNATIVNVDGQEVSGSLLIKNDRIVGLGEIEIPDDAQVIDCSGKFIYPGMIDSGTGIGIHEVGSISLTNDADEIGNLTPQAKALTAVNPNSVLIPVTRVNGITSALTLPSNGLFPGTAALINLFGFTPDQMDMGFQPMVMNFPRSGKRGRWDRRSAEDVEKDNKKALKELDDYWKKATQYQDLYSRAAGKVDYNPEMEALRPVLEGSQKLLIEVNSKNDILAAIKWLKDKKVDAIFMGVKEGYRVADSIALANIPVIVGPILDTPGRDYDAFDSAYKNASILHQAGIKVAIRTSENENVRNLPYHAGFAAAYGLGREEAFRAVTINPAEIFGLDKDYGSLELGKVANLFICDGDPFEPKTVIEQVFIKGYKIPMESRHSLLYDEFLERSPGLNK